MQKNKKEMKGFYTRESIKKEFAKQCCKMELSKVTIKNICEKIPISRNTFYMHYEDIQAVQDEIENDLIEGFLTIYSDFEEADFQNYKQGETLPVFTDTLCFIKLNSVYFLAFVVKNPDHCFISRWKKIIKDHFRQKWEREKIQYRNRELFLEMTASSAISAYAYWVEHEDEIDLMEMSRVLCNRLFYELLPVKQQK